MNNLQIKIIFLTLLVANGVEAFEDRISYQKSIPLSVLLNRSSEVISGIDFNNDSKEDINMKLQKAEWYIESARKNLELRNATWTEVKE